VSDALTPARIMEVGMAFWPAKTLLSAVELGLFTTLGANAMTGAELERALGLHGRANPDFFDTLVALRFLDRDGDGADARYRNTAETARFLDRCSPHYVGGFLEMANARLYPFWGDLTEALRTGKPQNETKHGRAGTFEELYSNGLLSMLVAQAHPHIRCISVDLPAATAIAARKIQAAGLDDRVSVQSLDFFNDPLPRADVITMGMILHDWNLEKKMHLVKAAYNALPTGGAFVAIENIIDDARRENAFGLMMSLNMLIEFGEAFDFTGADFDGWCRQVGFRETEVIHLAGPASAAIAYK
jgi:hypothetical protein